MKTKKFLMLLGVTLALLAILVGCEKPDEPESRVPLLSTAGFSDITETTATGGGCVIDDGGAIVTACGVCWSTGRNPTIVDIKTTDSIIITNSICQFKSNLIGLTAYTTYYVRAYATNSVGTAYGDEKSFTTTREKVFNPNLTYGTVTDIDGNVYKTIQIGTQVWMAENLKTTRFNDGASIPNVTDDKDWFHRTLPGYCWYNNNVGNKSTYGALYNWFTVNTGKLCPEGWHVPTDAEWHTLVLYLDPNAIIDLYESMTAGNKLKEAGTPHWKSVNPGATNESGFTALPGGWRTGSQDVQTFWDIGYLGQWWSSTEYSTVTNGAWMRFIMSGNQPQPGVGRTYGWEWNGYSVRCVKD